MKINCNWNEKMKFTADADGHKITMDAKKPIGNDSAPTPKQLLLAGVCGCTAMDVVAYLNKTKQTLESCQIEADAKSTEGKYPSIFEEIKLLFILKGQIDEDKALESVVLSQTKYCGVSAMIVKAVPISYSVELNGRTIGAGQANFK